MTLRSLIADLVRIETENPPGNEAPCAEYVADWFEERDIDATLIDEPDPDRPQVAAEVGEGSPTMVLNGHLDVVPAGDRGEWDHDPYAAEVEGGRLYGRGAADMKTGVAIAMLTLDRLADDLDSGDLDGRLVFHGAMGEETADPGTRTLLSLGYDGDYGVCLEPTGMRTATSQKGLAWYEITVPGEPGHASRPDAGTNAIEGARPVLDALADYDDRVREREHSLLGPAYATVTRFRAGTKENVIPESARITVDRRFLPDESPEDIDEEIESVLADVTGVEAAWERTRTYESAEVDADSPLAEVFRDHSARVAGAPREPWGIQASTDGRNLINDADMEAVIWGPGDLAQAHSFDEYVDLDAAADGLDALEGAVRETLETL